MTRLLTITLAALTAVLLLASCGSNKRVTGTGNLETDTRRLLTFNEVELQAPVDVVIVQGESQSVNVTAQANIQPLLLTEVKGDKLTIKMMKDANMDNGTNVEIVIADLESLDISSSGNAVVRDFAEDKFTSKLSGSGNVSMTNVRFDNLKLNVDGSGDITVDGQGDDVNIDLSSSGDVDADSFTANDVQVKSDGSGDVRVMAKDTLKVEIKGSGNVYYKGNPEVDLKDEGAGELKGNN